MLKKLIIIIFVFSFSLINVFAQENSLKKVAEDLKIIPIEDNLLEKIDAYKKVIDLALEEVKDLKVKLLNLDKLSIKDLELQTEYLKELNEVINYYEKEKEDFLKKEDVDLIFLKKAAENFKKWREDNYLPINNKIIDFILIKQQLKALEVTKNRYQKIDNDFKKISSKVKNQKIFVQISNLLNNADIKIKTAENYFQLADDLFKEKYLLKDKKIIIDDKKTSSLENFFESSTVTSVSTSSFGNLEKKQKEIKDLIYLSFEEIKQTYGYFLEISKLLKNF